MPKIDLKKDLREFYNPPAKAVTLVDVPAMNFVMIGGQGAPESEQYQHSVEALFSVAYTIKFTKKKTEGLDYVVMPLEGLWWAEDMSVFESENSDRNAWQWNLMIMQPAFVTNADFLKARETSAGKNKSNTRFGRVLLENFEEGKAAQIMHHGPFAEEGPNVQKVHQKILEIGARPAGKHHEIYLSDYRRVGPAKMKTIIRQPYV